MSRFACLVLCSLSIWAVGVQAAAAECKTTDVALPDIAAEKTTEKNISEVATEICKALDAELKNGPLNYDSKPTDRFDLAIRCIALQRSPFQDVVYAILGKNWKEEGSIGDSIRSGLSYGSYILSSVRTIYITLDIRQRLPGKTPRQLSETYQIVEYSYNPSDGSITNSDDGSIRFVKQQCNDGILKPKAFRFGEPLQLKFIVTAYIDVKPSKGAAELLKGAGDIIHIGSLLEAMTKLGAKVLDNAKRVELSYDLEMKDEGLSIEGDRFIFKQIYADHENAKRQDDKSQHKPYRRVVSLYKGYSCTKSPSYDPADGFTLWGYDDVRYCCVRVKSAKGRDRQTATVSWPP
ncbi:MAG: hypothetical protein ACLPKB_06750 [Xanthobacteraceae bacterium]